MVPRLVLLIKFNEHVLCFLYLNTRPVMVMVSNYRLSFLESYIDNMLSAKADMSVYSVAELWGIFDRACKNPLDKRQWKISIDPVLCVIPNFRFFGKAYVIYRENLHIAFLSIVKDGWVFYPVFEDLSRNDFNRAVKMDATAKDTEGLLTTAKFCLDRSSAAYESLLGILVHKRRYKLFKTPKFNK